MENNITKPSYTRPCVNVVKVNMGNSIMLENSITESISSVEGMSEGSFGAKGGGVLFDDDDNGGGWGNSNNSLWDE